ncbi:hypothetical protein GCM10008955_20990 [Deinococcus malanensis]|uniref:DUF3817 domain-containing protein n=1 Tax=Deinococcus malanensis TaxID=1706855 RepID=A0ABQ2EUF9_9DEIO|nr:hypothetical protein [Deinococcus malanensis]GGK27005.1 hypothetical protein GCM10008955_20990 [Deinococcus malanensis]
MPILDSLEKYRTPGADRLQLYAVLFGLLVVSAVAGRGRPGDLSPAHTLKRSPFARVMFMDIGVLSTLGAVYLVLKGRTPVRVPAALASLFAGSFALLPALAYEDWLAMQEQRKKEPLRNG